jgi:hypothetical protein
MAMRWENGAGSGWLLAEDETRSGVTSLLLTIAANPVESQRWDGCHFLWKVASQTRREATTAETARLFQAFAQDRMKKRKNRKTGRYAVEVLPLPGEASRQPQTV